MYVVVRVCVSLGGHYDASLRGVVHSVLSKQVFLTQCFSLCVCVCVWLCVVVRVCVSWGGHYDAPLLGVVHTVLFKQVILNVSRCVCAC